MRITSNQRKMMRTTYAYQNAMFGLRLVILWWYLISFGGIINFCWLQAKEAEREAHWLERHPEELFKGDDEWL